MSYLIDEYTRTFTDVKNIRLSDIRMYNNKNPSIILQTDSSKKISSSSSPSIERKLSKAIDPTLQRHSTPPIQQQIVKKNPKSPLNTIRESLSQTPNQDSSTSTDDPFESR